MVRADVAIIGGGPVGMGLAIDLAQRGISVAIFEKYKELHQVPKGQNLTQRTGEHFKAWGIYDAIKTAITMPKEFGSGGITAYPNLLSQYHYDWFRRADVSAFYGAENMRIPQYDTEAVLRKRVAELPNVQVFYGCRVEDIQQPDDSVALEIACDDESKISATAKYAVGCDGARSVVREQMGITQSFRDNFRRMVLAVFKSDELNTLLARYPGKSYFYALSPEKEGYWQFLGRVGVGTWFFHTPVPADSNDENLNLGEHLAVAVGESFAFETQYLGFWDLRFSIADTYRADRVFIAGDAAHSHPPYGGYGVNNGFEDARNLSWKLAAMLKGWGSETLLDSYTEERKPVFDSTADDFIRDMISTDAEFVANFDPARDKAAFEQEWTRRIEASKGSVNQYCPNYSGASLVVGGTGPTSAVGEHAHKARPGYLLSPKDGLMEKIDQGFNLISAGGAPETIAALKNEAESLGIPLNVIEMPPSDETAQWQTPLILLRPDRYIAAIGDDLAAPGVLAKILGR